MLNIVWPFFNRGHIFHKYYLDWRIREISVVYMKVFGDWAWLMLVYRFENEVLQSSNPPGIKSAAWSLNKLYKTHHKWQRRDAWPRCDSRVTKYSYNSSIPLKEMAGVFASPIIFHVVVCCMLASSFSFDEDFCPFSHFCYSHMGLTTGGLAPTQHYTLPKSCHT